MLILYFITVLTRFISITLTLKLIPCLSQMYQLNNLPYSVQLQWIMALHQFTQYRYLLRKIALYGRRYTYLLAHKGITGAENHT